MADDKISPRCLWEHKAVNPDGLMVLSIVFMIFISIVMHNYQMFSLFTFPRYVEKVRSIHKVFCHLKHKQKRLKSPII